MLFLVVIGYLQFSNQVNSQLAQGKLPSLHLAKLTWTEVDKALREGYDTILIPTAGIEQNGPHVILGKHNVVVTRTTHDIAQAVGNALGHR